MAWSMCIVPFVHVYLCNKLLCAPDHPSILLTPCPGDSVQGEQHQPDLHGRAFVSLHVPHAHSTNIRTVAEDDDSDDEDDEPILSHQSIKHVGAVNRVRVCPTLRYFIPRSSFQSCPHEGSIVATWSDTGKVHIFDMSQHLQLIDSVRLCCALNTFM